MVRSIAKPLRRFRGTGFWDIKPNIPPSLPILPTQSDNELLSHVTLITAVDNEILKVPETTIDSMEP